MRRNIRDESGHIADARHDTGHHTPTQVGTVQRSGLVNDRTDAFRLDDTPNEEGDTCNRGDDGLHCEEVPTVYSDQR